VNEPPDLRKALAAAPAAKAAWEDLTSISRRDFIAWIDGAKQAATRARRIERACSMLADGKRRPCCFSIVPFDLYQAFKTAPKAKMQWSALDANAKRDLIAWIEAAKQRDTRKGRIEEACAMLGAGKTAARRRG